MTCLSDKEVKSNYEAAAQCAHRRIRTALDIGAQLRDGDPVEAREGTASIRPKSVKARVTTVEIAGRPVISSSPIIRHSRTEKIPSRSHICQAWLAVRKRVTTAGSFALATNGDPARIIIRHAAVGSGQKPYRKILTPVKLRARSR
jgi:hypothetical protein